MPARDAARGRGCGLGRALPRGEALFVLFNCDVVIGEPMNVQGKSSQFVKQLTETYDELFTHCLTRLVEGSGDREEVANGE